MPIDIDPVTGAPIVTSGDTPPVTEPSSDFTVTDPPSTEAPPTTEAPPPVVEEPPYEKTEKELCLEKMNAIEAEAGGFSNIGMTSDYWELLKKYRSL